MVTERNDALSRLGWGLARWWWVLLIVVGLVTAPLILLAPRVLPDTPSYEARALVVANELDIRAEQLPRLAETMFTGGNVADRAVDVGQLPWGPRDLIPEHAELEPLQDNILLIVIGRASDPQLAARTADVTAEALVEELNAVGPGLGSFSVQTAARVPEEPQRLFTQDAVVVVSVIVGLATGLGMLTLLLVLRRPVIGPREAAAAVDAELLGVLRLPRGRGLPEVTEVLGLSALARRVHPEMTGVSAFVGLTRRGRIADEAAVLVTLALGRFGPVDHVPLGGEPRAAEALYAAERVTIRHPDDLARGTGEIPTVISGSSAQLLDVPQHVPAGTRIVLVAREGIPSRRLEKAREQFLEDEVAGVVFLARRWRRSGQPAVDVSPVDRPDRSGASSPAGSSATVGTTDAS